MRRSGHDNREIEQLAPNRRFSTHLLFKGCDGNTVLLILVVDAAYKDRRDNIAVGADANHQTLTEGACTFKLNSLVFNVEKLRINPREIDVDSVCGK